MLYSHAIRVSRVSTHPCKTYQGLGLKNKKNIRGLTHCCSIKSLNMLFALFYSELPSHALNSC